MIGISGGEIVSEFSELVKSIAKSREYVRDFYIYGFKSREDFDRKSARTYDNERRRLESWLAPYVKSDYNGAVKNVYLSINTNMLPYNPLYRVFEAKSFTDNDIMLHFYLIDILSGGGQMTADELADEIAKRYEAEIEIQLVRKKANEYVSEGILGSEKAGRRMYYFLLPDKKLTGKTARQLDTAVSFFQLDAPLGFIGYSIMKSCGFFNDWFLMKHGYFAHALEDEILLLLLTAINGHNIVRLKTQSNKHAVSHAPQNVEIFPLKIFVSTRTGRRFLCVYYPNAKRLSTIRLDHIKEVTLMSETFDYNKYNAVLRRNISKCFGLSFSGMEREDTIKLTLRINEPYELFVLKRLETEGRGGRVTRVADNTYTYEITVFDGNEMMPWIKTFTGRIISFESSSEYLRKKFYRDIELMAKMYGIGEG